MVLSNEGFAASLESVSCILLTPVGSPEAYIGRFYAGTRPGNAHNTNQAHPVRLLRSHQACISSFKRNQARKALRLVRSVRPVMFPTSSETLSTISL